PLDKPPYCWAKAAIRYRFRDDKGRQGDQKSDVCLNVMQEGDVGASENVPIKHRQEQRRQPRDHSNHQDSSAQKL
ncbi:MAG: hypothetical protein LAO56_25800, partial [Acidobacteriia bacterium]|nr:hypothetical protein [Terriglobia bacterium]